MWWSNLLWILQLSRALLGDLFALSRRLAQDEHNGP